MNLDKKQFSLKLKLELIWWVISAIIVFMVCLPIMNAMDRFDFWISNIIFILVFITYFRHIFFLQHSFLAYWQPVKFILIFASIPLIFKSVEWVFNFQDFLQTEGQQILNSQFKAGVSVNEKLRIINYLNTQYLFFGVAAVISAIVLPFRLLISYWRVYNKLGKV